MKKKISVLLLALAIMLSCSKDEVDCSLFDPLFPELSVRLVDENGINLIENGTINPDSISIAADFNNPYFIFTPVNHYPSSSNRMNEFDNSLVLRIAQRPSFKYTLNLNDTLSVDIDFVAELRKLPCGVDFYEPEGVKIKNEVIELREVNDLQFLAIIELD